VTDYTSEMFLRDFEKVIPLLIQYRNLEKQDPQDSTAKPEYAVLDIIKYFSGEYGNARGTDYHMRFLSVLQFVEHYQKDLESKGLLKTTEDDNIRLPDIVIKALLDSIKPPQPPSHSPSSPLYNRDHEFNLKKVIKVLKADNKQL
jgi:hypothetical protein